MFVTTVVAILCLAAGQDPAAPRILLDQSPRAVEYQINRLTNDELVRVVRLGQEQGSTPEQNPWDKLYGYVHPLVIGAVARAESLSLMLCKELLAYRLASIHNCRFMLRLGACIRDNISAGTLRVLRAHWLRHV